MIDHKKGIFYFEWRYEDIEEAFDGIREELSIEEITMDQCKAVAEDVLDALDGETGINWGEIKYSLRKLFGK